LPLFFSVIFLKNFVLIFLKWLLGGGKIQNNNNWRGWVIPL
jgi:hypothetical protein